MFFKPLFQASWRVAEEPDQTSEKFWRQPRPKFIIRLMNRPTVYLMNSIKTHDIHSCLILFISCPVCLSFISTQMKSNRSCNGEWIFCTEQVLCVKDMSRYFTTCYRSVKTLILQQRDLKLTRLLKAVTRKRMRRSVSGRLNIIHPLTEVTNIISLQFRS